MRHEIYVKSRMKKVLSDGDYVSYIPGGYCKPLIKRTFVDIDGNYYCCEKINQIDSNTLGNVFNDIDYNKVFLLKDKINTYIKDNCSKCWAFRFCDICFTSFLNDKKMNEKCNEIRSNYLHMLKLMTYEVSDVKELV